FDATEEEFRALFKLQRAYDKTYTQASLTNQDLVTAEERRLGQQKLQEDFRATLGEERYADYQRASDPNYQQTARLVTQLQLPRTVADNLYSLQKEYQQRA